MSLPSADGRAIASWTVATPAALTAVAIAAALLAAVTVASWQLAVLLAVPVAVASLFGAGKAFARTQRLPAQDDAGCNYATFVETERTDRRLAAGGCCLGALAATAAVFVAVAAGAV